jgi:hypothetical protein
LAYSVMTYFIFLRKTSNRSSHEYELIEHDISNSIVLTIYFTNAAQTVDAAATMRVAKAQSLDEENEDEPQAEEDPAIPGSPPAPKVAHNPKRTPCSPCSNR